MLQGVLGSYWEFGVLLRVLGGARQERQDDMGRDGIGRKRLNGKRPRRNFKVSPQRAFSRQRVSHSVP